MKSIFLNSIKVIGALFLSICILSFLLLFYSITPVHMKNKKGNTDYVWPANSLYVKMTEGMAWGRFDANGYNNLKVIEKPDILLLGSSHMEATNVMQNKSVVTLLNDKLNGKYTVYNMGISGHNFYKVCQYLPTNLELYENNSKMVIIETSSININQESVDSVLNHTVSYKKSYSTGLIGMLQRVPFFRTIYHQVHSGLLKKFMNAKSDIIEEDSEENLVAADINVSEQTYIDLFFYLENLEKDYGVQIVIFYHPIENLNVDGTLMKKNLKNLKSILIYIILIL